MTRATGQSATLKAMIAAVKLVAAEEIMPRYLKVSLKHKGDGSLCTEADLAAQESLTRKLQAIVNVPVIGEEMSADEQAAHWVEGHQGGWCIDPIDGTSNFIRGVPYFAVSVALIRDGKSMMGVIHDPVSKETFSAERGRGAYLNGVSFSRHINIKTLSNALVNIDFKRLDNSLATRLVVEPPYASQRTFGASSLDWCYVAAGRVDAYLHGSQKMWDYAAGSLVLEEVGGHFCTLTHDNFEQDDIWQRSVVAALDPELFAEWKSWLRAQ